MPELQAYWDLLAIESDKRVVLVFYKNPTEASPQRFGESFLDALSKFDGEIVVVTDTPVDNLPLQQFSERDSQ